MTKDLFLSNKAKVDANHAIISEIYNFLVDAIKSNIAHNNAYKKIKYTTCVTVGVNSGTSFDQFLNSATA